MVYARTTAENYTYGLHHAWMPVQLFIAGLGTKQRKETRP